MAPVNFNCVQSIEPLKNSKDSYMEAVRILLTLLDNVIREPKNEKYRVIRFENKTIKEKLLTATGAEDLLMEIGFVRASTEFVLPSNVSMSHIMDYREAIFQRLHVVKNTNSLISRSGKCSFFHVYTPTH